LIPLSLGDPTVYGNFLPPEELTEAIVKAVRGRQANGYTHSAGSPGCRSAVRKVDARVIVSVLVLYTGAFGEVSRLKQAACYDACVSHLILWRILSLTLTDVPT